MNKSPLALIIGGAVGIAVALTGCVPNSTAALKDTLAVNIKEDSCAISSNTTPSGAITFTVTNNGSDVNEFEILAQDKLRIVGEKENIGPGVSVKYVVQLQPGTYYTECKPGMVGSGVGTAEFVVTDSGKKTTVTTDEKAAIATALTNYVSYVKDQSGELLTDTKTFVAAYEAGDTAKARALFPATRAHYERIEPTAESFGDLDPALDLREKDLASGEKWVGWHRIEKDLWPTSGFTPSDAAGRKALGDQLVSDTQRLYDLVYAPAFATSLTIDTVSNGAIGLLEEVANSKITGEEEAFSHTDLWDFKANVEGAEVAFGTVRDIAATKPDGKALVTAIDAQFARVDALLAAQKKGDGYRFYDELSASEVKGFSDAVNALSEPLSKLTATLVG
jgi:iron uptake system component EfeO